jgi:hypothetical protein
MPFFVDAFWRGAEPSNKPWGRKIIGKDMGKA